MPFRDQLAFSIDLSRLPEPSFLNAKKKKACSIQKMAI
jgi:hypothetical protein